MPFLQWDLRNTGIRGTFLRRLEMLPIDPTQNCLMEPRYMYTNMGKSLIQYTEDALISYSKGLGPTRSLCIFDVLPIVIYDQSEASQRVANMFAEASVMYRLSVGDVI